MLRPGELLIGDHNWQQHVDAPPSQKKGLIPRNYRTHPRGFYKSIEAVDFPLIDRSEWPERAADLVARHGQLSDIMLNANVPCLDQNGRGYCWGHSGVGGVMAGRAVMNEPTIGLSAYSICCKIKNFRDEGGWGAQAIDFMMEHGVCDETVWPQRGTSRSLDTPAAWVNAKKYRVTMQMADMQTPQYNRNLTFEQYITLLLQDCPCVCDFNWWSHSVMGADAVNGSQARTLTRYADSGKLMSLEDFEEAWGMHDPVTAGWGIRIRNSWGLSYGDRGFGVLTGSKAVPDGGVGIMIVTAA